MSAGKLYVISGASGVGKGTVLSGVMAVRTDLAFSVSATTRPPRPSEEHGVHYYFISKEEFEEMIAKFGKSVRMRRLSSLCPPPWRSWSAGFGVGAIPPRSRS